MSNATTVKERPIMFSGFSVREIRKGLKMQTRRLVKPQPKNDKVGMVNAGYCGHPDLWLTEGSVSEYTLHGEVAPEWTCPHGRVGDRLYVKEGWWHGDVRIDHRRHETQTLYKADAPPSGWPMVDRWRSPMFMPRKYSRMFLEITGIRAERLHQITTSDAIDEGALNLPNRPTYEAECQAARDAGEKKPPLGDGPIERFAREWDKLNGKRASWASNPWVWVIDFKVLLVEVRAA